MTLRWFVAAITLLGCSRSIPVEKSPKVAPVRTAASTTATAEPEPPKPAVVEKLVIAGDVDVSIVRDGKGGPPAVVFLPGVCSNANAYLQYFPEAARRQGGVIAIEGDQPCAPGFRTLSGDVALQEARIAKALKAAGLDAPPPEGLTLIGYSRGATVAEQLVQRAPSTFPRLVLIGSPNDPNEKRIAKANAVITMSCEKDVPFRMKSAAKRIAALGIPTRYMEMPRCTHGNLEEGEATFDDALKWLRAQE